MPGHIRKAFAWIVAILRKNGIRFRVSGGLAARAYGSTRPLKDIDIEVQEKDVWRILPCVKNQIIFGPKRYVDKSFDLLLLTLRRGVLEYKSMIGRRVDVLDLKALKHDRH